MSYLKVKIGLKKHENLILVEKIKCNEKEFKYFPTNSQFTCKHLDLRNSLKDFKKFCSLNVNLNYPSYLKYYDISSSSLKFNDEILLSETDYFEKLHQNQSEIFESLNSHLNCFICNQLIIKDKVKEIRKRKKLSLDEKVQISYAIGANFRTKSILKNFNIGRKTFKDLKRKIVNRISLSKKRKDKSFTSLTELEQQNIIDLVSSNPNLFFKAIQIKNKLKLKCSPRTIRNLLKFKGSKHFLMDNTPYLTEHNKKLKDQFALLVKDLPYTSWSNGVFTDEKILQSYNNGRRKCYRLKINRKRGIGFDKR